MPTWETATDWNNNVSEDDVEHSSYRDATQVRIGQPDTHLTPSAFYRFHSGSGSTLVDVSGNANDATINGPAWTTAPGRFAGALNFNSADNDGVNLPEAIFGSASNTQSFYAAEAWVYPEVTGRTPIMWFKSEFTVEWDDLTSQGFSVRIFGDNTGSIGPTGLSLDAWHHVNVYWNVGTEIGVSVNGGAFNTYATSDGADGVSADGYHLGRDAGGSNFADIRIAEARMKSGSKIAVADSLYQTDGTFTSNKKSL